MAHLEICHGDGSIEHFNLFKRLSVIGTGDGVDISLKDPSCKGAMAYISQSGTTYILSVPQDKPAVISRGLPVRKMELQDEQTFSLGATSVTYRVSDKEEKPEPPHTDQQSQLLAYKHLVNFSERIAQETDIDMLLATLLKEITQLTGAEHGFLMLMEDGVPTIKVQEFIDSKEGLSGLSPISDSIVKKVIVQKEPIIVSDALNHREFSSSLSVINYRLSSVMCVPLMYQGTLFGAIYVGNNSFTNAFNQKSLELMSIYSSQAAVLVQNAIHINALKKRTKSLQESLELSKFGGMIGGCPSMQQVFSQVEKVAQTDVSVLIFGEAGTGKELIARELHNRSLRKDGPFVVINCSAVPEDALESELFGHVRGAFSGAVQSRVGKLQTAHNGTLYLDEISEMPTHLQIKILRVLQEQCVTKIGDSKSEPINVRVIASTNRDLETLVKNNTFREDLYYRLNVVQITAPPLKERGNDVLVIANYFLQKYTKIYGKNIIGLDEEAQNAILNFEWPGNVRQLENRIRRAVVMCDHNRVNREDLGFETESVNRILPLNEALERFRMRYISESLERNAHNRTKTASELGVDPRTIFRHLEGLKKEHDN